MAEMITGCSAAGLVGGTDDIEPEFRERLDDALADFREEKFYQAALEEIDFFAPMILCGGAFFRVEGGKVLSCGPGKGQFFEIAVLLPELLQDRQNLCAGIGKGPPPKNARQRPFPDRRAFGVL